jgi:molecular chaperone DnaJ
MQQSTLSIRDYYEVLGVARDADAPTIKAAFRRLARRYHPDRSTEPDAEERFKEVAEAYAVLSDPAKRADYDTRGTAASSGFTTEDLLRTIDLGDLLDAGLDMGGALFGQLFNGPGGPGAMTPRGSDVCADVEVPLVAVACGTEAPVRFSHTQTCPICRGTGGKPGSTAAVCGACRGTGQRTLTGAQVLFGRGVTCEQCGGTGRVVRAPCAACSGWGHSPVQETVTVKIPPGIEEGAVLRVRGRGQASPIPGAPAGDLHIVVHSAPHSDFERRGPDLWRRQSIPVTDAVLGTNLTVASLQDTVPMRIPPGSQPGTVLRLDGQGLPHFRRRGRGDLYITLDVAVPSSLTRAQRQHYEQLRESPPAPKHRFWRRRPRPYAASTEFPVRPPTTSDRRPTAQDHSPRRIGLRSELLGVPHGNGTRILADRHHSAGPQHVGNGLHKRGEHRRTPHG